jgi:Rnl2 family RNA ligase
MEDRYDGYEKIPQTSAEWGLDEHAQRQIDRATWTVTEKIHGANLCVLIDADRIVGASRREVIPAGDSFFGHERVLARHDAALRALWTAAQAIYPTLERLDVHGELFGGAYPHPDVPAIAAVEAVQTGCWYAPDVEFMAFDLAIWTPDESGEPQREYLGYTLASALCQEASVPWLEALLVGSWAQALAYPIEFTTTIPALLGLPPLEGPNPAEGVVIKPVEPLVLDGIRPVLKRKIAAFAEDERFHNAQAWQRPAPGALSPLTTLEWELCSRLNVARLDSAISKVGRTARERVSAEVARDVLEEVMAAHADLWGGLKEDERELLRAVLEDEASALARR